MPCREDFAGRLCLQVRSIGFIGGDKNAAISAALAAVIESHLGIPATRTFFNVTPPTSPPPHPWRSPFPACLHTRIAPRHADWSSGFWSTLRKHFGLVWVKLSPLVIAHTAVRVSAVQSPSSAPGCVCKLNTMLDWGAQFTDMAATDWGTRGSTVAALGLA